MNVGLRHSDVLESQRPITVDEYHHMIEAGTLGEDDHVQLIAGAIVAMTPQGPVHALVIQNLTRLVAQGLAADLASTGTPTPRRVSIGRRRSSHPRARWLRRACRASGST